MEELFRKKIGLYQCGALKKKGNDFGAKAIKRWLSDHSIRWAWQDDVKQYYETIPKKKLKIFCPEMLIILESYTWCYS